MNAKMTELILVAACIGLLGLLASFLLGRASVPARRPETEAAGGMV